MPVVDGGVTGVVGCHTRQGTGVVGAAGAPPTAALTAQLDGLLTVGLHGTTPVAANVVVPAAPTVLAAPPPQPDTVAAKKMAKALIFK
ncbi:hypothetical protein THIX_10372 [Thiomonas sp. X19]|nr:hypothetical protein THIX_10372 [Thiomonas sp. X19]